MRTPSNGHDSPNDPRVPRTGRRIRLLGLSFCLGGVALSAAFVGLTAYAVQNRATEIMDPAQPVALGLIALVIGLNLVIFGERAKDLLVIHQFDLRHIRPWTWAVLLASVAVGILTFVLIGRYLESLGFTR
jgi:hypothetical protein